MRPAARQDAALLPSRRGVDRFVRHESTRNDGRPSSWIARASLISRATSRLDFNDREAVFREVLRTYDLVRLTTTARDYLGLALDMSQEKSH